MRQEVGDIDIDSIRLSFSNPRYSNLGLETQEEIIDHLCRREQVFELAKSIRDEGLNPLDRFGLLKLRNKSGEKLYEVHEGNRRICALQLLHDPQRAPIGLRKKFRELAQGYETITRVAAVIFDDKLVMRHWMSRMHLGEQGGAGRRSWSAEAKANFDGDSNQNELAKQMFDRAVHIGAMTKEQTERRLTTMTRWIRNKRMKTVLGINNSDKKGFRTNLPSDDFDKLLRVIIEDLLSGTLTSRHKALEIQKYADNLCKKAGVSEERVSEHSVSQSRSGSNNSKAAKTESSAAHKRLKNVHESAELRELLCNSNSDKLVDLYNSICKVPVDRHCALVAAGCWALIECLTSLAGRDKKTDFYSFYSNKRLGDIGLQKSELRTLRDCLKRIAGFGNTIKHHPVSTLFDAPQLVNDMQTLEPVLIGTIKKIETDSMVEPKYL